ncbi:MAG: cobyrinate a,c-diamide synthase [Desulfobacterales bacterium]|nr:MAG: cobyrinate a,c-diamide synthase [Desulfobacterales bacterium]
MKGLVIAGTKSGCGKTTVSLGLMAALAKRGLTVAPFKVGPDFIDPGHHTRITGATSRNLDGWMLSKAYNLECFHRCSASADIAIVEGVMGLYDGYDGRSETGSTAQMAKWLGLPVILMVDAKSMARSAAALVSGFEHFDKELMFAGVMFNHLGSNRHLQYLNEALVDNVRMPCLGGIPHNEDIVIPERHLGLVTPHDHALSAKSIEMLANLIEENIDLDKLINNLPNVKFSEEFGQGSIHYREKKVRIGVARDKAFCFYYQDNFDLLEQNGAELIFFSPISDSRLPPDIDGLYFGGGYPELNADALEKNVTLRNEVNTRCIRGMPIYAECGGFMYLCDKLWDQNGNQYAMAGCFALTTKMFPRLKALGYREVTLKKDTILGKSGQRMRGHEFHYSELHQLSADTETVYRISDRAGMEKPPGGYVVHRTLGSYNHLHFGSQPETAKHFVESCVIYQRERKKDDGTRTH